MKTLFCPKCKKDKPSNGDFFEREDLDVASKKRHAQAICKECGGNPARKIVNKKNGYNSN